VAKAYEEKAVVLKDFGAFYPLQHGFRSRYRGLVVAIFLILKY
jgi:hypothetical protein